MPTTLTPTQQLAAAQIQANNLNQQQLAQTGILINADMRNNAEAVLNSGAYPDLDLGVNANGEAVFFIPGGSGNGQGESITPIRDDAWNGTPLLSNDGLVVTSENSDAVAAAQSAAAAAQQAASNAATTQSAEDLANAQAALAAAQARVAALQAQSANTQATDTTPASSSDAQAASSAANQQQGTEISGVTTTNAQNAAAIAQQNAAASAAQQADLATLQAQYSASNTTNTAQSSGGGTINSGSNALTTGSGPTQTQPADAVPVLPSQGTNVSTSGVNEDAAGSAVQTATTNTSTFSDQQSTTNDSPVPPVPTGSSQTSGGATSATVLSSGSANAVDSGVSNPSSTVNNNNTNNQAGSKVNILHGYTNYTYRISLFGIPKDTINQIYSKAITPGNESLLLNNGVFICADGGNGGYARSSYFPVDLTIDNVELETIVDATSSRTRATNVVNMKFDIIEPYTVNFLARLKQMAADINPNGNWSTTFFVMKIDFLGYNDQGQPQSSSTSASAIPGTTKYIPFTFTNMKFSVTGSGGKYSCTAIPTNALALTALDNQIPFHVELSGQTVDNIFNAGLSSSTIVNTGQAGGGGLDRYDQAQNTVVQNAPVAGNQTTVYQGLAAALNSNEQQKVEQKTITNPNTYKFTFLDPLISAKVNAEDYIKIQSLVNANSNDANTKKQIADQGKIGSLTLDLKGKKFTSNPGTRITDFIGSVMTVSDYMLNQYKTDGSNNNSTLNTWIITPVVNFNDIDPKTNYYTRDVEYVIAPYKTYGQDKPGFGQLPVQQSQIVKTYKYIYSGDNRDVLDANIQFEVAFWETVNGVPANYLNKDGDNLGQSDTEVDPVTGANVKKFFMPRYMPTNGLINRTNTGGSSKSQASLSVQELMDKLYDNRGDMIVLDLTIVGDPDWISQDYSIMHPSLIGNQTYLNNGSVNFTNPVYFNFYFATPNTDYDDTTGLFGSLNNYSEFSGIYRVITVKSNFSNGKFTQKLTNNRVRTQTQTQSGAIRSDSVNPNAPTASNNAGNAPVAEAAKNTAIASANGTSGVQTSGPTSTSTPSANQAFNDNTGQPVVVTNPSSGVSEDHGYILGND